MDIADFEYHRPSSLDEAIVLGAQLGEGARFLAGGTDLLVDLKNRAYAVTDLISLSAVPEIREIRVDDGGDLVIGAGCTLSQIERSPEVAEAYPGLAECVRQMAAVQIRNRATIGGNFCAAVPCADTPSICMVGRASVQLSSSGRTRALAAEDFFEGPRKTAIGPGEMLVAIRIPRQPACSGASYQRLQRRKFTSLAIAAVAARVVLEDGKIADARVALTAVAPTPLLVPAAGAHLVGHAPDEVRLAEAALIAAEAARPISDVRAGERHRRDLVEALTMRALRTAAERAAQGGVR